MPSSANHQPIGYIERRSSPISMDEWIKFAVAHGKLIQMEPVTGVNPFTRKPLEFKRPYSFHVQDGDVTVGAMMWEESEVVFVSGVHSVVDQVVADTCAALRATFEPLASD